jgi:hypothetical protein
MFEEMSRESIRAGGFISGHKANRLPYFLFSEGAIEGGQIMCQQIQFRSGEVTRAWRGGAHRVGEMILDEALLILMSKKPTPLMSEALNEVLPSSPVRPKVKIAGVGVSLSDISNSSGLFFPCFLHDQPSD